MEKIDKVFLRIKEYLPVVAISLISTIVSGYQFAVSDQEIFIPYIYKLNNNSLFRDDALFSQFSATASFFYSSVAYLIKFIDIQILFFTGFIIFKALLFIGIYQLGKLFFKRKEIALLSLLPFTIPKFVGGTATYTYDYFFGYRSVGLIFLVFYLLFLLKKDFLKSTIIASIGLFIHPLSIIPNLILSPVLILKNSKSKLRDLLTLALAVICFSILYSKLFRIDSNLFIHSSKWLAIVKSRDDYIFVGLWNILGWLSLGLYLSIATIYIKIQKSDLKSDVVIVILTSISTLFINYILLELLMLPGIAKFQLARTITPIALISLSISPCILLFRQKLLRFIGTISFVCLCLNSFYIYVVSIGALTAGLIKINKVVLLPVDVKLSRLAMIISAILVFYGLFFSKSVISFPLKKDDWVNLQLWVQQNTKEDSKFLVPPQNTGFRIFSQRPIVGDIKDGAVVVYDKEYAIYWNEAMNDLKKQELTEQQLEYLSIKYNFHFAVFNKQKQLNLPVIYENNSFLIYKL